MFFQKPLFDTDLLDQFSAGIAVFDAQRRPIFANQRLREMFDGETGASLQSALENLLHSPPGGSMVRNAAFPHLEISLRTITRQSKTFTIAEVRDRSSEVRLLREQNEAVSELERSRDAALRIMEDLIQQKTELQKVNESLTLEVQHRIDEVVRRVRVEQVRDRLAAIVECSDDAIFAVTIEGVITSWNGGAKRLYGYEVEEIVGQPLSRLFSIAAHADIERLLATLDNGLRGEHFETCGITRSGRTIHLSVTLSPLSTTKGQMIGASIIGRDITKRIEVETELHRYREQLEFLVEERTRELIASQEQARRSERMASVGALAAGIAHEINNPVGAMLLAAQNSLDAVSDTDDPAAAGPVLQRLAKKIITNARRCSLIVKGILQFSKEQATERWPNDLNTIARSAHQLLCESINTNQVTFQLQLAENIPQILVNSVEFEQVLINLLKNAVESRETGVFITLTTAYDAGKIRIIVEDNGRGITPQQLEHVFDPFYTTRQNQGGTGLGLSIVHGIVRSYGGTIDIKSTPGRGTSITVELPPAISVVSDPAPATLTV